MDKQLIAACEIADHEVRLVVAEFYNTRLHILKVERVATSGFDGRQVIDEEAIVNSIKRAVENASKNIGASIQQVLLLIPSIDSQRIMRRVTIDIDNPQSGMTIKDVQKAYQSVLKTVYGDHLVVVNSQIMKYIINGIAFRRLPTAEQATQCIIEMDIYLAQKNLTYQLASCVEQAGLKITDIVLDAIGLAKEAALIEQSVQQTIIAIRFEKTITYFTLFGQGKLLSSEAIDEGFGQWISLIMDRFNLPVDVATRLLMNNGHLHSEEYTEDPIYLWSVDNQTKTCSQKELSESFMDSAEQWRNMILKTCEPIFQVKNVSVVLTGAGAYVPGLQEFMQDVLPVPIRTYCPETLGVRDSALTAIVGAFYAYKDLEPWRKKAGSAVNLEEFNGMISHRRKSDGVSEDTFGKKIKGILGK